IPPHLLLQRRECGMRIGVYTRISKDPDGTSTSPARQEQDCRAFAKLQGHEVVKTYTDVDISAYSGADRPGYEQLMTDLTVGIIDGVLVWRLDRLTRNFDDLQRLWKLINGRG